MPVYKPNLFYPQECREKGYTRVLFARHLLISCTLYPTNDFRTGTSPHFYFGGVIEKRSNAYTGTNGYRYICNNFIASDKCNTGQ